MGAGFCSYFLKVLQQQVPPSHLLPTSLVFIELLKNPLGVPMAAATVHPQRSHFGWADGWTSSHSFLQLQSPKTAKITIMTQTHEKLSM